MGNVWTDTAKVERLKVLFHDGATFSQIACELGVTRNAAIGKCNRLGLFRVDKTVRDERRERRARPVHRPAQRHLLDRIFRATEPRPEPEPVPETDHVEIPIKGKTLFELEPKECRWPVGDPCTSDFRFCGREIWQGHEFTEQPYCHGHARIAYQGIPRKRDDGHFVIRKARAA